MSKPENYYGQKPMPRSLTEIQKCTLEQKLSCVYQPLIETQLENIILDELHLMLRITAAINWDKADNMNKCPCERTTAHLDALIGAINNCRVCFQVWEKKDTDGKRSGTYDFTSLMGNDKKLLLEPSQKIAWCN
ncbi:Hypothetical predicted protein [Paramuricea clavata]|uniref:Uncharacterized protein n=1 Tax=Paramuricea clavata TaxID=317549 RepID=A0A6S7FL61_PARCT|nr:Hypothetical predicted protein [Paramuricea clavata]